MNNDYNVESNSAWRNIGAVPFVTVVTPVYNDTSSNAICGKTIVQRYGVYCC